MSQSIRNTSTSCCSVLGSGALTIAVLIVLLHFLPGCTSGKAVVGGMGAAVRGEVEEDKILTDHCCFFFFQPSICI